MSRNPYAPPEAVVAYDESGTPRAKPGAIRRAVFFMWASLALNFLILAIDWKFQLSQSPLLAIVVFKLIGIAITIWLILKIAAGRNWARFVYLALVAVGLSAMLPEIVLSANRAAHVAGMKMIELGMDFGVLYLVFFPGDEWFRKRKPAAAS